MRKKKKKKMDWHAEPFLLFPFSRCFCCLRKIISLWPPPIFKILSNFLFLNDRPVFFSFFFFSLLGCVLLAQPFLPTAFFVAHASKDGHKARKTTKKKQRQEQENLSFVEKRSSSSSSSSEGGVRFVKKVLFVFFLFLLS